MSEELLEKAKKEREKAEALVNALKAEYAAALRQFEKMDRIVVLLESDGNHSVTDTSDANGAPMVRRGTIVGDVVAYLQKDGKADQPFKVSEVTPKIKSPFRRAKSLDNVVCNQIRRRQDLFTSVERGKYRLKAQHIHWVD